MLKEYEEEFQVLRKRAQSDELLHARSDAGRAADFVRVTAYKKR